MKFVDFILIILGFVIILIVIQFILLIINMYIVEDHEELLNDLQLKHPKCRKEENRDDQ